MKKKILIVDDVYANRYIIEEIFDETEYEVHGVPDAAGMRGFLKEITPDIILMDINLPDQDGFEITKELRLSQKTRDIPVIFLTVHNTKSDVMRAINAGGSDFISKPFDQQELKYRVEKVLRRKMADEATGKNKMEPS